MVFPSKDDITLKASDVLSLLDKDWLNSLTGVQERVMKWFKDYLIEVEQGVGMLLQYCYNLFYQYLLILYFVLLMDRI